MKQRVLRALIIFAALLSPTLVHASVIAKVDISSQRMHVYVNGALQHSWAVSTARRGYRTPIGSFRPKRLERRWYSRKYHMSPMPYSIFFLGGYAIHGTNATRYLGRRASHGCIRLAPGNARRLFHLVRRHGMRNSTIRIRY
jgi:lipoprotein-anchoring transpeptidase ErfK/SrfK